MVNQIFRFFGHQWIYDADEMQAVATEAGFAPDAVTECSFQEGRDPDVAKLDQPSHSDDRCTSRSPAGRVYAAAGCAASPPGRRLTGRIQTVPATSAPGSRAAVREAGEHLVVAAHELDQETLQARQHQIEREQQPGTEAVPPAPQQPGDQPIASVS